MYKIYCLFSICLAPLLLGAQEIVFSGEKYEKDYEPLQQGQVLTDTSNYWEGFSEFYEPSTPVSFFSGAVSFSEVDIDEFGVFLYGEQPADFTIIPLFVGNQEFSIWEITAHPPGDSLAEIGRITVQETDTSFTLEYNKVAFVLSNFEFDSLVFLDAHFTYQLQLDYKNDKIRYHFGEIVLGSEGEAQMEEFSILSAMLAAFEFTEGELQLPFIFADKDPNRPEFVVGDGDFEELPPYNIKDFPKEGTVYEFSMDVVTTSTEEAESPKGLTVYPNPGRDQLMITHPSNSFDYEIRDVFGRLMQEGKASQRARVTTADWPVGVYFISAGQDASLSTKTWIKAH